MQPDRLIMLNLVRDLTLEKLAGAGGAISASPGTQQPTLPALPTVGSPTGSPTDQKQSVAGAAGIAAMGQANALAAPVAAPAGARKGPNLVTAHAQQTAHAGIRKVVQPKGGEVKVAGWLDQANQVALDAQNALASPGKAIQEGLNELPGVGRHLRRADQWVDRNVAQPVGQGVNKALNYNLGKGETPARLLNDASMATIGLPVGSLMGGASRAGLQSAASRVPSPGNLATRGLAAGDSLAAKAVGQREGLAGPRLAPAGGAPMGAASVVRPSPAMGAMEARGVRAPTAVSGGRVMPPATPAAGASPVTPPVTPPAPVARTPEPGAMSSEMQKHLAYRKYMAENTVRGPGQTGVVPPPTADALPQYRFTAKMQTELKAARDAAREKGSIQRGVDTVGRALLRRESPAVVRQTPGLLSQFQDALPASMRGVASAVDSVLPQVARMGEAVGAARPWYGQLPGVGGMLDRAGSVASNVGQLAKAIGPQVGEAAPRIGPGILRNPLSDKIRPGAISIGATGTAVAGAAAGGTYLHNNGFNPVGGPARADVRAADALRSQYPEAYLTQESAMAEVGQANAAVARDRAETAARLARAPAGQPTAAPASQPMSTPTPPQSGPAINFIPRKRGR